VRVTVPSFAKLNLDLRVLSKRADGYHELRTIFQTVSLKDSLRIDFDFAKQTRIDLDSSIDIADNLVLRATELVIDQLKIKARIRFQLKKQIPMGAGLGGGSSNAAAVLIALPALAGRRVTHETLSAWAETLGSDVPFFLHGGTALGMGRGSELYPLPDLAQSHVLVVSTGIHVSTAEAYKALDRSVTNALTSAQESPILREFQAITWVLESAKGAAARRQSAMESSNISGGALDTAPVLREFLQRAARSSGGTSRMLSRITSEICLRLLTVWMSCSRTHRAYCSAETLCACAFAVSAATCSSARSMFNVMVKLLGSCS
jgi:4-diphosphocytidyl-2C-methyl-D-erythritol kinase